MNSLLSGLMQTHSLMESSVSELEAELSKLQASGQDDQITESEISRLTSDLDLKRSELYSVLEQIYQIQSAPISVTSFYSPETDSWNSLISGGLSTSSIAESNWQQQVGFGEFQDNAQALTGIVLQSVAAGAVGAGAVGAGLGAGLVLSGASTHVVVTYLAQGGSAAATNAGAGYLAVDGIVTFGGTFTFQQGVVATGLLASSAAPYVSQINNFVLQNPQVVQAAIDIVDGWANPPPPPLTFWGGVGGTSKWIFDQATGPTYP